MYVISAAACLHWHASGGITYRTLCWKPLVRQIHAHVPVRGCSYAEGAAACHQKTPGTFITGVPNTICNTWSHSQNPLHGIFVPGCEDRINVHAFEHCLEPCFLIVSYLYTMFSSVSTTDFLPQDILFQTRSCT